MTGFLLVLAAAASCAIPPSTAGVGLWESQDRSKGGIGHTVELRADGSFIEATTVIVDAFYSVAGDQLTIRESLSGSGMSETHRFRIDGKSLVETGPRVSVGKKDRVGPTNAAIVGAWKYRHPTGATAFEQYTTDGRLLLRIPLASSKSCYTIDQQRVTMKGDKERQMVLDPAGNTLTLKTSNQSDNIYAREPLGPWYDREHFDIKLPVGGR